MANYVPQVWTDNVTPVDAAHMAHIEAGLGASVPADGVAIPAARVLASYLAAADTQPAFRVMGDGKAQWGAGGGTATDTALYRLAANQLRTDGFLFAGAATAAGSTSTGTGAAVTPGGGFIAMKNLPGTAAAFGASILGDTQAYRFFIDALGKQQWSDGTAVTDTNLYRAAAGVLQTDGSFYMRGGAFAVFANTADANSKFYIASSNGALNWGLGGATATDTNLYRSAAGILATAGQIRAGSAVVANDGTANQVGVGTPAGGGLGPGLSFGVANDTNIFRFAANFLGTNSDFVARQGNAGQVSLQSQAGVPYIYFGSAQDTNLYRAAAATLKTDGAFYSVGVVATQIGTAGQIQIGSGTATPAIYFGNAGDTALYRDSAAVLRSDGALWLQRIRIVGAGAQPLIDLQDVAATSTQIFRSKLSADSQSRFNLYGDGRHEWGLGGATATDTTLYRSAANTLKTDGIFQVVGDVWADLGLASQSIIGAMGPGNEAGIRFGSAADTRLYRGAANVLKTDGALTAVGLVRATVDGTARVGIGAVGPASAAGIIFSSADDTNLYRAAAATLKTDGALQVGVTSLTGGVPKTTTSTLAGGPPASPGDGDIWIATAVDANGTRWKFQYNAGSASAYKWEFIGGPPMRVQGDANVVVNTKTQVGASGYYYDPATMSVTVARAGDYVVSGANQLDSAGQATLTNNLGAFAAAVMFGINSFSTTISGFCGGVGGGVFTGVAAGTVVGIAANPTAPGITKLRNAFVTVTPIRIA